MTNRLGYGDDYQEADWGEDTGRQQYWFPILMLIIACVILAIQIMSLGVRYII